MNDVSINKSKNESFDHERTKLGQSIPLKFKAMILKSIYEKHCRKQKQFLKDVFHSWYIQKNQNQMLKNTIDRILIAQNEKGFTASRFFYRMKFYIRKEKQRLQKQQINKVKNKQKDKINEKQSKIEDSQINCHGRNNNFTQYFESLKNIFSIKFIELQKYENQLKSNKVIPSNLQFQDAAKQNLVKFKTQGNENEEELAQNNQSKISIFTESESSYSKSNLQLKKKQQQKIKKLGCKVALTVIRSTLLSSLKRCYNQGFYSVFEISSIQAGKCKISQINNEYFNTLQEIINDSQSHLSIQSHKQQEQCLKISQNFIESESELSFYVPPISIVDSQMSQVQYSINLLSNAIKKDEEVQQLYKQFQLQYQEFQNIQKDFDQFKIRTKSSLFDKTMIAENKIITHFLRFAFSQIKKHSNLQILKKNVQQFKAKSKVNITTFHEIFSKTLTSAKNTMRSMKMDEINSKKYEDQQKQSSITSIRDFNLTSTLKSQRPFKKGGIKKQNLLTNKNLCKDEMQERLVSTFDIGFRKDKATLKEVQLENSINDHTKNVNFQIPKSISSSSISENEKVKDKTNVKVFMNDPNFYDLSSKTLESNESSETKKYHTEIKSQYWWNYEDEKQALDNQNEKTQNTNIFQSK